MATTSGSDSSSLAPTDFRLCCSLDDSSGVISVAVEHCQLCDGTRRLFYCKDCVQNGEFVHSRSTHSDRYADKMRRWYILKKERLKLLERIEKTISKSRAAETKKYNVEDAEERVQLLRKAVSSAQDSLTQVREDYDKLRNRNISRRERCERFEEKRARILRYLRQTHETYKLDQQSLEDREATLYQLRRQHISDLGRFIFPIVEIQPKSDVDSMVMSTVSALAEARYTRFIRGRWVYTDNGGEHQYRIVEPTLPGNGDYSSYNIWLSENRDGVPNSETELGQRNPAYTLSAALTYTTQLLSLLAYFLDINLPKRLCYSEFCGLEKSEVQFQWAVSRLNHNILHMCFTQNIHPELLHPRHSVHNLVLLLRSKELGRGGSFQVNPELMQSLDESNQSESSDIDVTSSEDELDHGDPDWERVPVTLPEDIPSRLSEGSASSRPLDVRGSGASQTTSMAGGIMSSVASFWRAATSTRTEK